MTSARKLLYPFSLLYAGVTGFRNILYDKEILKSHSYDLPVICVGNLSVGGTGKSPMVEYLIRLLKENYKVATLSRGYKRSSSGFLLLTGAESAAETGDEPLQFKLKFPEVQVAVDESRSHGIDQLLRLDPKPEIILLDDAFQHRKVSAGLNILLTPYDSLYSQDLVLPAGNLREPISGAQRAQIVVVTKCPEKLSDAEKKTIAGKLNLKPEQQLFFSTIKYASFVEGLERSQNLEELKNTSFTLVTGIAKPAPLVKYLRNQGLNFHHLNYPDHHNFTARELDEINEQFLVLTTEKDFMRLKGKVKEEKLFYLPIQTAFLEKGKGFDALVESFAQKK